MNLIFTRILKWFVFFILLITLSNCNPKEEIPCLEIEDSIFIENKAFSCFQGKKNRVLQSKDIHKLCRELSQLKLIEEHVAVNFNSGYIEIFKDGRSLFFIIFSDMNGPIIRYKGKDYRNDTLIIWIMEELEIELKESVTEACYKMVL